MQCTLIGGPHDGANIELPAELELVITEADDLARQHIYEIFGSVAHYRGTMPESIDFDELAGDGGQFLPFDLGE